jgi:hypothetical protein
LIDDAENEKRRLERLDSPRRIAWLRSQLAGYIHELAVRSYFRLPTCCAGEHIPSPKDEALAACINLATSRGLTADECYAAFKTEWEAGMKTAVQVGEKLRITALSHIKVTGGTARLEDTLKQARNRFPVNWPYLTDENLSAIAAGFQRPAKPRRAA